MGGFIYGCYQNIPIWEICFFSELLWQCQCGGCERGGNYLFSSGSAGSAKLYLNREGSTTNYEVAADLKIAGDSGTGTVSLGAGQTLTVAGGTGLDTSASNQTLTFSVDLNEMGAGSVAVGADSFVFVDADDNATKKESFADLATAMAGSGLAASSGVLALDMNELSDAAVASGDKFVFIDATDNSTKKESIDDISTFQAGTVTSTGLAASSGVLKLDIQNLTAATSVADGDLVVIDDGAGGTLRKMTRANFIESAALDSINIDGGAIDGTAIGANSAAAGTFTALVGTSLNVSDGNITNVGDIALDTISADDGSSFAFGSNWTAAGRTCANLGTVTTADINGGTIDGASLGTAAAIPQLTAPYAQITNLDVVTLNSVSQTETTLEISDKLIVASLSASSANSADGGLRVGGGANSAGHASVLYDHGNTALDFNIAVGGSEVTQVRLADGVFRPESDSDVDLGASGAAFKKLYVDDIDLNGQGSISMGGTGRLDLDGDDDTSIRASADDVITFECAGADQMSLNDGALYPSADNDLDLGSSTREFKDLYLDGVAYIDDLRADALGAALNCASQAMTNVNVDSGAIDGTVIGANSAAAGTFAALVGTSLSVSDGNITNVGDIALDTISADDGSSFSMGSNWTNASRTVADMGTVTTMDLNGGSIDGTTIGAAAQAAGTFTNLSGSGWLKMAGAVSGSGGLEMLGQSLFGAGGYAGGNGVSIVDDGSGNHAVFARGQINSAGNVIAGGFVSVGGGYGDTGCTLSANGNVSADGSLRVGGNAVLDSALTVGGGYGSTGFSVSAAGMVQTNSNLTVDGSANFRGGYGSTGVSISSAGAVSLDGNLTAGGSLNVGGGYGSTGLSVSDSGALSLDGALTAGSDGAGVNATVFGAAANEKMQYVAADNLLKLIDSSGTTLVSIGGDASSEYAVDVANGSDNKNKIRAAAFVTYSDETLKTEVGTMDDALSTVKSLNGVEFTWKDSGQRDFGFIAQDVEKVIPNAVHTADDGVQGVDYSRLTSVLVEAVKAQQEQIDGLKKALESVDA